jgi:DNA-binding Lrp family transcriptional regulator
MGLDKLDIRILEQLQHDGRASFRKIAGEIGVSPSTVSSRVSSMRNEGILQGFSPDIDFSNMGYNLTALIEVTISTGTTDYSNFTQLKNVVSVYEVTGTHDIVLICRFRDRENMNRVVTHIRTLDEVEDTYTQLVLTTPKHETGPDLSKLRSEMEDK